MHDLSDSPVAMVSMVTTFMPWPRTNRVSRSNPGAWLVLRLAGDSAWEPMGSPQVMARAQRRRKVFTNAPTIFSFPEYVCSAPLLTLRRRPWRWNRPAAPVAKKRRTGSPESLGPEEFSALFPRAAHPPQPPRDAPYPKPTSESEESHGQEPPHGAGGEAEELVDHISRLPNAVLGEIISLLPTKDAARAQTLASRWRRLWLCAPLNLDCSGLPADDEVLAGLISGILEAHPPPPASPRPCSTSTAAPWRSTFGSGPRLWIASRSSNSTLVNCSTRGRQRCRCRPPPSGSRPPSVLSPSANAASRTARWKRFSFPSSGNSGLKELRSRRGHCTAS
ncbi:uncharacterized protein LOC133930208 [Phragmites australis]|uniref:uncharacterized protein LOC133930208 n=1 Tax=Phragmites australis TaxID=29695 RepID=UPI002D77799D|nr:uncharacterized protein LOC133930208 [Phragmites australis]